MLISGALNFHYACQKCKDEEKKAIVFVRVFYTQNNMSSQISLHFFPFCDGIFYLILQNHIVLVLISLHKFSLFPSCFE